MEHVSFVGLGALSWLPALWVSADLPGRLSPVESARLHNFAGLTVADTTRRHAQ
jgi:hypothetical protein